MNPEELEQLKELIDFLKEHQIGEFALERGDMKVSVKFGGGQAAQSGVDMAGLGRLVAMQSSAGSAAPAAGPRRAPPVHARAGAPVAAEAAEVSTF